MVGHPAGSWGGGTGFFCCCTCTCVTNHYSQMHACGARTSNSDEPFQTPTSNQAGHHVVALVGWCKTRQDTPPALFCWGNLNKLNEKFWNCYFKTIMDLLILRRPDHAGSERFYPSASSWLTSFLSFFLFFLWRDRSIEILFYISRHWRWLGVDLRTYKISTCHMAVIGEAVGSLDLQNVHVRWLASFSQRGLSDHHATNARPSILEIFSSGFPTDIWAMEAYKYDSKLYKTPNDQSVRS